MREDAVSRRIGTLLLLLGPVTSLAISPWSNFDPINLVKMIFVTGVAFSTLFLIITLKKELFKRLPIGMIAISIFFISWMFVVMFFVDAPLNQQFWGVFGRNNGLLSYLSLVLILFAVTLVQTKSFYHKLVDALVLTAVPMTLYALLQIAGRDPISWSVMAPFATLGNINFSSAFFGLASICALVLAVSPQQKFPARLALLFMVIVDLLVILETGSIQGFMIFVAGAGVVGFFWIRSVKKLKFLLLPYLIAGAAGFVLTALALKNIGPIARFVFGDTILFRFDYWFAGWAMTLKQPLVGVGLDSYGDWYRALRGEIATLRTTPDRITNTAHNIYLDISASGGFPLIFAYLTLLGFALRGALRVIKRDRTFNPYFVALFSTWVAYLIQAAISINQIGVGIWGWLFTGALIGYEIVTREEGERNGNVRTSPQGRQVTLSASAALMGLFGFVIGSALSLLPFNADAKFKDALQTGSPRDQFVQSTRLGATAFHMNLALDSAIKANDEGLVSEIVDETLRRYPRDFMAWRVKQVLTSSTVEEREEAFSRLKEMDPYNPTIEPVG